MAAILEISLEFRATHRAEEDRPRARRCSCWCEPWHACSTRIKAQLSWLPNYWSHHAHYHITPPTPAITRLPPRLTADDQTKDLGEHPPWPTKWETGRQNRGRPCRLIAVGGWQSEGRGLPAARPRTHWAPVPSGGGHTRFLPRPLSDFLRPSSRGS